MLSLLISIRDIQDDFRYTRPYNGPFSFFVVRELLDIAYERMGLLTEEADKATILKNLLRDEARRQGVAFDPDQMLEYGYIAARNGFWFRNVTDENQALELPLDPEVLQELVRLSAQVAQTNTDTKTEGFRWPWQRKR
jgi:hypothetical protein